MAADEDTHRLRPTPLQFEQLTTSYRFDAELASLLTEFQYRADGITLTATNDRPLPAATVVAHTAGLEAVFGGDNSLVFVCYDDRGYQMVNPVETTLITALTQAINTSPSTARSDGGTTGPLGEGPDVPTTTSQSVPPTAKSDDAVPTVGVVTPHNAQRGRLEQFLSAQITANTVEQYQGGERDIIVVSATVTDPEFARREERFILNLRRLLVAISRSKLLTVVVCSTSLFEVAPQDSERLDDGPVWARLFTQAVGRDPQPAWTGPLAEFTGDKRTDHADVPVQVYPSEIDTSGGER
ncbi:hypothetical protein K0C01_02545 [Salinarchaeum sp. IM2453]|uniref:AAA domain-containing protein n=1 Tax=Salinarchaeum sp. IM2453 TaxID=2862870 RepID=UPI001C830FFD|nr:AAA domain-containing protein [Salinarchaeum sp. IM2453]QZA89060.1 hypothetical protein K0C01_02545 [Salinarchaeum sp. IM2453]